ncbi:Ger(x)C family spore germination protein [Salinithrix halophila]|uniref:Ger(X)C family spore germination protein n=1 Tax=Salinithrix halophila TaxID=1485204 RepID=A0ABV8JH38_9BACL
MKRKFLYGLQVVLLILMPGCGEKLYLEQASIVLVLGLDKEQDTYKIFHSNPVFNRQAEEKVDITTATGSTLRETTTLINNMTTGKVVGGKLQNILIGKRLLRKQNAFPLLDVLFRDPKNETNARVIVVDGPVQDVMYADTQDKGMLGTVIRDIVESSSKNGTTVLTRLLQFHRQIFDKRITPHLSEMTMKNDEITVTGTALLDRQGKYATSLNNKESTLLLLLQGDTKQSVPLMLHQKPGDQEEISINIDNSSVKVSTDFQKGRFVFDIGIQVEASVTERKFPIDWKKETPRTESLLQKQVKKECENLVKKIQQHQLDPIGLGIYAKSHRYAEWKRVEKEWGKALSKAKITISPEVKIKNYGVSM